MASDRWPDSWSSATVTLSLRLRRLSVACPCLGPCLVFVVYSLTMLSLSLCLSLSLSFTSIHRSIYIYRCLCWYVGATIKTQLTFACLFLGSLRGSVPTCPGQFIESAACRRKCTGLAKGCTGSVWGSGEICLLDSSAFNHHTIHIRWPQIVLWHPWLVVAFKHVKSSGIKMGIRQLRYSKSLIIEHMGMRLTNDLWPMFTTVWFYGDNIFFWILPFFGDRIGIYCEYNEDTVGCTINHMKCICNI